jgi:copper resistance protein B
MIVDDRAFYREPEAALSFYSKDDPSRQIGSGLSDLDTGVRLRYEISRKVAPYIGFAYTGKYGKHGPLFASGRRNHKRPPFRIRASTVVLKIGLRIML